MSERSASTYRRAEFTSPHLKVLEILSREGIFYRAEEVIHCWGKFDGMGRQVSFKVDVVINDPRYGAGIIEIDGEYHHSNHQLDKTEKRDKILKEMGFWIEHIENQDAKNVMMYLARHRIE